LQHEEVLEMDGGDGCAIPCMYLNTTEVYTQKW
jgi:hypothetical protein